MPHTNVLRVIDRILRTGMAYLCVVIFMHSACQAEQPTLDEAISALESWRASFNSIHITYEIDEGVIEDSLPVPLISFGEYYWSEKKRFYWHEKLLKDGIQLSQQLDWGDGSIGGRAIYPHGEGQAQSPPRMIEYGRIVAGGYNGAQGRLVTPLYGIWQPQTCRWLPEVLREEQATSRVVSTDGVHCLEVTYQKDIDRGPTKLVLDPRYSYLPRSTLFGWDGHASEFKRFPPGIWIPTVGVLDLGERKQSWEIKSVVFNEDIADEKVRAPKPGEGTRITDITQLKSWFHGSPAPIPEETEENETFSTQDNVSPAVAKPTKGITTSLPFWLGLIGISTLAISSLIRVLR